MRSYRIFQDRLPAQDATDPWPAFPSDATASVAWAPALPDGFALRAASTLVDGDRENTPPAGAGTSFKLSSGTIHAIQTALKGPGINNINYYTAYQDIYNDMVANGQTTQGSLYWFSQAGSVNDYLFSGNLPSAAAQFIWNYTKGAAAYEGATVTDNQLQTASNEIASQVFTRFSQDNWIYNDTTLSSPEGMKTIIGVDAGRGVSYLQSQFPNAPLDYAIWGGTLFAQTILGDPTYVADYGLMLFPGSLDCTAINRGDSAGTLAVLRSPSAIIQGLISNIEPDANIISACFTYQPEVDLGQQFAQSLIGGTAGFAQKYVDLTQAFGDLIFNPVANAQLTAALASVATDFAGYYAVRRGTRGTASRSDTA